MTTVWTAIGSTLIGGIITWLCSWRYYKQAGQELKDEATELRRLNNLMLHGMEHAGWIKLNRDESGTILGFEQVVKTKVLESTAAVFSPTHFTSSPPIQSNED